MSVPFCLNCYSLKSHRGSIVALQSSSLQMRTKAALHTPTHALTYRHTHLNCAVFLYNYLVILTVEIAVKPMVVESVFLQADSLKDTHTLYFYLTCLLIKTREKAIIVQSWRLLFYGRGR